MPSNPKLNRSNIKKISMIKFDCYDKKYKSEYGAIRCNHPVRFCVHADKCLETEHINMIVRGKNSTSNFRLEKCGCEDGFDIFGNEVILGTPGFYRYRFELVKPSGIMYFAGTKDGHTAVIGDWLPEWKVYAYDSGFTTPDHPGCVMYQIFPDRFFKSEDFKPLPAKNERIIHQSWNDKPHCCYDYAGFKCNDFFCGNLLGIQQKLEYIKSLGVTHIYLNPIFESAENHRYSTSDYMNIDPFLGSNSDFISLCKKAREYDIKIILDGVFSHTGDDSIYFNKYRHYDSVGAYNDKSSKYFGWYNFSQYPDNYDCWWGFKTLPNVNETNKDYMEFITSKDGVLRHWMKLGAYGWRLDVADELPDEFLNAVRCAVKAENPDALIIGEVWENAVTKCSYGAQRRFLEGFQCDSVMNYPFSNAICDFLKTKDADKFYNSVMEIINDYPAPAVRWLMNMLSTHDTARIINRLALDSMPDRSRQSSAQLSQQQRSCGIELMKIAVFIQYTLPGIPCVFYGDEEGLDGFEDPFCRAPFPWDNQEKTLLNLHRRLGIIRKEYSQEFLKDIEFLCHSENVISYMRGELKIIINLSERDLPIGQFIPIASHNCKNGLINSGGAAILRRMENGKDTFNI